MADITQALTTIGDMPGWIALVLEFLRRISPATASVVEVAAKQRMPHWFGIGRADEQIFESLHQLVSASNSKRHFIDLVIKKMKKYERGIFRLTVAGMSCGGEIVDKPVKNPPKGGPKMTKEKISWESTVNDLRVKYLEGIADEVAARVATKGLTESKAAAQVVKDMRNRQLITRSPEAQKALEMWAKATAWLKKEVFDFFKIDDLDKLTSDMIVSLIKRLTACIPDCSRTRVSPVWKFVLRKHPRALKKMRAGSEANMGFWKWLFKKKPIAMAILLVASIGLAIWFFILINISN